MSVVNAHPINVMLLHLEVPRKRKDEVLKPPYVVDFNVEPKTFVNQKVNHGLGGSKATFLFLAKAREGILDTNDGNAIIGPRVTSLARMVSS